MKSCHYCEGKGYDIFQKEKPCPFCSVYLTEEEKSNLIEEKVQFELERAYE
jgi:hypothetical protein